VTTGVHATIHRIIAAFDGALEGLDLRTDPLDVERWSVLVHEAMANRARFFHGSEHIFDVVRGTRAGDQAGADPLETLAILFHDVVYVQVDGALDQRIARILEGVIRHEDGGGYRLADLDALAEPLVLHVAQVFGLSSGQELSPFAGLNEFASALVAARQLGPLLREVQVIAVAACIEATIPFRGLDQRGLGPYDRLAERLRRLSLDGRPLDEVRVAEAVTRAVRVANSDVGNFGDPDPATFLDHTWNLLPESNPALQLPTAYTVRQYRVALHQMEVFLSTLSGERVFHRWGGVPDEATYRGLVARAGNNLGIGVRYLRVKLYTAAILESLAMESGGDAPLELFAGAIPRQGTDLARVERHLPIEAVVAFEERRGRAGRPGSRGGGGGDGASGVEVGAVRPGSDPGSDPQSDPGLLALFVTGRAHDSSFDLRGSPLSAFLYRRLGEAGVEAALPSLRDFSAGRLGPMAFLRAQSPAALSAIASIAWAASRVATTRTARLGQLALGFAESAGATSTA
jgi:hypothetical protein